MVEVCFMLDAGAAVSLHRKDVWNNVDGEQQFSPWTGPRLVGVEGTPLEVHGVATLEMIMAGESFLVDFVVVAILRAQLILGLDFLESHQCVVNTGQKTLHLKDRAVPMRTATNCAQLSVALQESIHVAAFSEVEVMAESREVLGDGVWLHERYLPVLVAGAVVTPLTGEKPNCVPLCLVKP